jgi:hypothetical protein
MNIFVYYCALTLSTELFIKSQYVSGTNPPFFNNRRKLIFHLFFRYFQQEKKNEKVLLLGLRAKGSRPAEGFLARGSMPHGGD